MERHFIILRRSAPFTQDDRDRIAEVARVYHSDLHANVLIVDGLHARSTFEPLVGSNDFEYAVETDAAKLPFFIADP